MAKRSYEQICGVAASLDLLGDRWSLLIIRELLLGPKRFGALRKALGSVSANMLSARLDQLQEAGIVGPADVGAGFGGYALTDRGEGLRSTIEAMAVWGLPLLDPLRQAEAGWPGRGSWLAFSLAAAGAAGAPGDRAPGDELVVNFDVDGDRFTISTDRGRAWVRHGQAPDPDGELSCDVGSFFAMTERRDRPADPAARELLELLPSFAEARGLR